MNNTIAGSATTTYELNLTEKDEDISVTFSTQPILTVTMRDDGTDVLSQVTWSGANNQDDEISYSSSRS